MYVPADNVSGRATSLTGLQLSTGLTVPVLMILLQLLLLSLHIPLSVLLLVLPDPSALVPVLLVSSWEGLVILLWGTGSGVGDSAGWLSLLTVSPSGSFPLVGVALDVAQLSVFNWYIDASWLSGGTSCFSLSLILLGGRGFFLFGRERLTLSLLEFKSFFPISTDLIISFEEGVATCTVGTSVLESSMGAGGSKVAVGLFNPFSSSTLSSFICFEMFWLSLLLTVLPPVFTSLLAP